MLIALTDSTGNLVFVNRASLYRITGHRSIINCTANVGRKHLPCRAKELHISRCHCHKSSSRWTQRQAWGHTTSLFWKKDHCTGSLRNKQPVTTGFKCLKCGWPSIQENYLIPGYRHWNGNVILLPWNPEQHKQDSGSPHSVEAAYTELTTTTAHIYGGKYVKGC